MVPCAWAQTGFNPEFLGNGAPGPYGGLCAKYFASYFNQNGINAHDAETALELEYFSEGFTGADRKDQLLFLIHAPLGYRWEGSKSGGGLGTVSLLASHFWHLVEGDRANVWFDNGLVVGLPTATQREGIRIGGNSFSVSWYQEMFLQWGKWSVSIVPVSVGWGFKDYRTDERGGLALSVANGVVGRKIGERTNLGLNFGLHLGHLVGSEDAAGNSLGTARRIYVGPAGNVKIKENLFLQFGTVVDLNTKGTERGQGLFLALWHHFL